MKTILNKIWDWNGSCFLETLFTLLMDLNEMQPDYPGRRIVAVKTFASEVESPKEVRAEMVNSFSMKM